MDDETFYGLFEEYFGPFVDHHFPSKIAGATHSNEDGSDRAKLIADCTAGTLLQLRWQPDNPVDPKAIAVLKHPGGEQLGYLPERTAHDLLMEMQAEPEVLWFAVFRESYTAPGEDRIVGAVIEVACRRSE